MAVSDDTHASYLLLEKELQRRGFSTRQYTVGKREYAEYTSPNGAVWLTRREHFSYPLNHGAIMEMADNKTLAYEWMSQFDVSIAWSKVVNDLDELDDKEMTTWLDAYKKVVVKPESSSASRGLTLDIQTVEELRKAIHRAREATQFTDNILVQQQVAGEEIRLTLLQGKVVAILLRQPLQVVGDGRATLATLLERENSARQAISKTSMVPYGAAEQFAKPEWLTQRDTIIAKDEVVKLADSTLISGGASVFNIFDDVDPSYVHFAEQVVQRLGAAFIVMDLMTADYTAPMDQTNTYFNEFNKAPALKMFYACRDGKNYDIVPLLGKAIAKRMERT